MTPADNRQQQRRRRRRGAFLLLSLAFLVSGAGASVLLREDVSLGASAAQSDVIFAPGPDYVSIANAGYASLSLGQSQASAELAVVGISGAAYLGLTELFTIQNQDPAQAYTVSMARSGAASAAIQSLTITLRDAAGASVASWDALAGPSPAFTISGGSSLHADVEIVVADGTPAGSLGAFDMQLHMSPA